MNQFKTRQQKLKFLQDIQQGKATLVSLIKPITGVLYIHNNKVFAHQTKDGYKVLEEEIDIATYEKQFTYNHTHKILFKDYSNP